MAAVRRWRTAEAQRSRDRNLSATQATACDGADVGGRDEILVDRARIFGKYILRRELNVEQRGLDMGVPHQAHERGQTHTRANHVMAEGVPVMPISA